jgi:hypothetical protein
MKSPVFWYITPCSLLKVNQVFSIFRVEELGKQETIMKVGGEQSNGLTDVLDYIGNSSEMEDSISVPIGLPVGQN